MGAIQNLFFRKSSAIHVTLIILIAIGFLVSKEWVYNPLSESANLIFKSAFLNLKLTLQDTYKVRQRNRELLAALMKATVDIAALKNQRQENERLRAQLGFDPPAKYSLIPMDIVSVSYRGVPVSIQVNQGKASGLAIGQPVVNRQGLVGRINEVSNRFARVQLLTDPGCRVSGRVSSSRELGIARYDHSRGLILDNVPIGGEVKYADSVLSSGLGGVFPEGLFIGLVDQIEQDKNMIFAEINLKPAVNFNAVDELFALTREGDTLAGE